VRRLTIRVLYDPVVVKTPTWYGNPGFTPTKVNVTAQKGPTGGSTLCLTLALAALAGIAGAVTAQVADSGSALVVVVVVALGLVIVGLLEWTHRRGSGLGHTFHGADLGTSADRQGVRDRDTMRALDELRSV
jgi:apolipoprotein N-acyltransferase